MREEREEAARRTAPSPLQGGDFVNWTLHRRIRSYVRREGRMTRAQHEALERLGPSYIVSEDALHDLDEVFRRRAPRVLEIGFGMGDTLAAMAKSRPQTDYLGIEVHRPGVGSLLRKLEKDAIGNVRIVCADAVEVLQCHLPDTGLDAVHLFFPDPWPKKRHHKRRIVQAEFADLVRRKLKPGGIFHMATDWEDYARQMLAVMEAAPGFQNVAGGGAFSPRSRERPPTKFERRGQRLGHDVWELIFTRPPGSFTP
jgi:tRNA (guanine-N7-)-methyltransferase